MTVESLPILGVGLIVEDIDTETVLIGLRTGSHAAGQYSIPGGKVDAGENFETTASRELFEKTNLQVDEKSWRVIAVVNNLWLWEQERIHSVSVMLHTSRFSGNLENKEPHKNKVFLWSPAHQVPEPHTEASKIGLHCFMNGIFYCTEEEKEELLKAG